MDPSQNAPLKRAPWDKRRRTPSGLSERFGFPTTETSETSTLDRIRAAGRTVRAVIVEVLLTGTMLYLACRVVGETFYPMVYQAIGK